MKKVLLIAFHYPPFGFSSGIQRTLKFSEYLPDFGWIPLVLSANPRAYRIVRGDQINEIPDGILVKRAFALDTARHLSIAGRYLGILALPDPWVTWCIGGVLSGLNTIRRHRPTVIWSTYPIATAHLIGLFLHRLTGIPWVADFRDCMTEECYPTDRRQRGVYRWLEGATIKNCQRAVFTAPGAIAMYQDRYPQLRHNHWKLISNGYDEEKFTRVEDNVIFSGIEKSGGDGQIVLLHSGLLYPSERDPRDFYSALAGLKRREQINSDKLKIILRATGHDDYHERLIRSNEIDDIVFLEPAVPYEHALEEMLTVDGLMILQAENCNQQIPAKIYEYLRAQRPILALTDSRGDTASLLRQLGIDSILPLDDEKKIAYGLLSFIEKLIKKKAPIAKKDEILRYSRYAATETLAQLFSAV